MDLIAIHHGPFKIVEERVQLIEVLHFERVELAFVTRHAAHRNSHPDGGHRRDAVVRVIDFVLFRQSAAFAGCHVAAIETGRHDLARGRDHHRTHAAARVTPPR